MEPPELLKALREPSVPGCAVPHDAYCRERHAAFAAPRLSAGLLHVVSRRRTQGPAVSTGDRAALGQLPGTRLRVEDDPWIGRRTQRIPAIRSCDPRARELFPLQSVRGRSDAHPHLHAICVSPAIRVARTHSAESCGGLPGFGSRFAGHVRAGDSASFASWLAGGRDVCLRAHPRRLPRAATGRWSFEHHGREYRAKPVRHSLRLAAGRGDFRLYFAADGFPAVSDRTTGE